MTQLDIKTIQRQQDRIFEMLSQTRRAVYLSGGTALHRFHLNSKIRFSGDLDFATVGQTLSARDELNEFIKDLRRFDIDSSIQIDTQNFKRIYVFDDSLQIDLMFESIPCIGKTIEYDNKFLIANIDDLFTNKVYTTYSRGYFRDFFDVFCILKNFNMNSFELKYNLEKKTTNDVEEIYSVFKSFKYDRAQEKELQILDENILNDFRRNHQKTFEFFEMPQQFSLKNRKSSKIKR